MQGLKHSDRDRDIGEKFSSCPVKACKSEKVTSEVGWSVGSRVLRHEFFVISCTERGDRGVAGKWGSVNARTLVGNFSHFSMVPIVHDQFL